MPNRLLRQRSISSSTSATSDGSTLHAHKARNSMASFDLNELPPVEEEVLANVEEMVDEACGRKAGGAHNGTLGTISEGAEHISPFPGQCQACKPAKLEPLCSMVHARANPHPVHHVISHRANGTECSWMSWLPTPHSVSGGKVIHSSEWITMPSIFTPTLARHGLANRAPGRVNMPDVTSAFSDPGRAWSTGSLQQVKPSKTTTKTTPNIDESHDGSDKIESYSHQSASDNRKKKSSMEGRSTVGLMELDCIAEDGIEAIEHEVPMPVGNVLIQEQDWVTTQHLGAENHGDSEVTAETDDIQGAELLELLLKQERKKKREADFLASFNFTTERCYPTAPCSRCLNFFKTPLPKNLVQSFKGAFADYDRPPILRNMDAEEVARRKESRHGPKSKSSEYRGVTYYKRTQRWESHVWHEGQQVYLGASATKEEAAKSYDKATLMLHGPDIDINYEPTSYQNELAYIYKLNKDQLVSYLRRDSRGIGAQATYLGVKHVKNQYQAIYKRCLWGTFPTEEEAARVVYKVALRNGWGKLASSIINTHHIRNMPSFGFQRYIAVYPEEVEAHRLQPRNRGRSRSTKHQPCCSPPPPSARGCPDPEEGRQTPEITEGVPASAKRIRRSCSQNQDSTQAAAAAQGVDLAAREGGFRLE